MDNLFKIRLVRSLGRITALYVDDFVSNAWQELQLKGTIEVISPTNTGKREFPLLIFRETGEIAYRYVCDEQCPHPKGWSNEMLEIV